DLRAVRLLRAAGAAGVHAGLVLRVLLGRPARGLGLARRPVRLCGAGHERVALPGLHQQLPLDVRRARQAADLRRRGARRTGLGGAAMRYVLLVARLVFGAWMTANGVNHFFFPLFPEPTGHEPLAVQLMDALVHSGLL